MDKLEVPLRSAGEPGLDLLFGGGLPIGVLTQIRGNSGTGKSLVGHQVCRAAADSSVYFLALSGPPDRTASLFVGPHPRYVDLGPVLRDGDPAGALAAIEAALAERPAFAVLDDLDGLLSGLDPGAARRCFDRLARAVAEHEVAAVVLAHGNGPLYKSGVLQALTALCPQVIELLRAGDHEPAVWFRGKAPSADAVCVRQSIRLGPLGVTALGSDGRLPAAAVSGLATRILAAFRTSKRVTAAELNELLGESVEVIEGALEDLFAEGLLVFRENGDGEFVYELNRIN